MRSHAVRLLDLQEQAQQGGGHCEGKQPQKRIDTHKDTSSHTKKSASHTCISWTDILGIGRERERCQRALAAVSDTAVHAVCRGSRSKTLSQPPFLLQSHLDQSYKANLLRKAANLLVSRGIAKRHELQVRGMGGRWLNKQAEERGVPAEATTGDSFEKRLVLQDEVHMKTSRLGE